MKQRMTCRRSATLSGLLIGSLFALRASTALAADTVVQVPLTGLLDARSVTTVDNGQLVVWTLPTDGGGLQNAFITIAGAKLKGAPDGHALPDDGHFAANARHPEVVLAFSNAASAMAPQTHLVPVSGMFTFAVPSATYSKLFLFFNGAAGGTTLKCTLTYSDASSEVQNASVPDYYADISATDPVIFNLATDLAKWDKASKVTEAGHHNITGVELHPTAGKTLTGVKVERGPNGYLVFWGATGVATGPVVGAGGAGAGGAAGAGGTANAGGQTGMGGETSGGGTTSAGASSAGSTSAGASSAGAGGLPAGAGGMLAVAGSTSSAGAASLPIQNSATDAGCTCRVGSGHDTTPRTVWLLLGAAGACSLARRRRHPR